MLIQVNKKLYVGFLAILCMVLGTFFNEIVDFNEKSDLYARQNLFHSKVDFNSRKFYFLDAYSALMDFQTIPYCRLIHIYSIGKFREVAYRYPTPLTVSQYWSFAKKQNLMFQDANRLRHGYALLSNAKEQSYQTKKCI